MSDTEDYCDYDGPPEVLQARDLPSVAKYMLSKQCKNVFLLLGAGISTSAGIPDFRSPETGLYANLARLNLPYPEAVFEINYFRRNPEPFYTLARELLPGRFRPTLTHSFISVLANHDHLHTCFTQNIDTLERRAGVPPHRIIEAHGSFADQHCIECNLEYDGAKMRESITSGNAARCNKCGGLVKPDIVFFGEALPHQFHKRIPTLRDADLLIVMGTSLTVHPFASLASLVPQDCPRVLINLDLVGDFGTRPDDVICIESCDAAVRKLAKLLGWEEELDIAWKKTEDSVTDFDHDVESLREEKIQDPPPSIVTDETTEVSDDNADNDEETRSKVDVDQLAEQVAEALVIKQGPDEAKADVEKKDTDQTEQPIPTEDNAMPEAQEGKLEGKL